MGKTTLAKALARSLDCSFGHVPVHPRPAALRPGRRDGVEPPDRDVRVPTGTVVRQRGGWPTRSTARSPKTQSALLEAMAERQVTVDGTTHRLERPFVVLATENPIEHEGTYPLPDSQLDRFSMRISMGYPERESEIGLLAAHDDGDPLDLIEPVLTTQQMAVLCDAVRKVEVAPSLRGYLVNIAEATRRHPEIMLGMSPTRHARPAAHLAGLRRHTRSLVRDPRRRARRRRPGGGPPRDRHPRGAGEGHHPGRRARRDHRPSARPDGHPPGLTGAPPMNWSGIRFAIGAFALAIAGRVLGLPELVGCGIAGLLLCALAALLVRVRRSPLEVERRVVPPQSTAGDWVAVRLEISNPSRWRAPATTLADPISRQGAADGAGDALVSVAPLAPNGRVEATYRIDTPRTRRDHPRADDDPPRGPVRPGGRHPAAVPNRPRCSCFPKVVTLAAPTGGRTDDPLGTATRTRRAVDSGEDFASLRAYVPGDDLRKVHWATERPTAVR